MPETAEYAAAHRPDLRERRRASVQWEIARRACDLFERQGFADTTVEQIADAAGISLRTFYRHCPGKEDVLTGVLADGVTSLVDALASRPPDEPLPEAARSALAGITIDEDARRMTLASLAEPALKARWLAAGRHAQDLLTSVIAARLGLDADALTPVAKAALITAVVTTATEYWALHPEVGTIGDVAAAVFTAAVTPPARTVDPPG